MGACLDGQRLAGGQGLPLVIPVVDGDDGGFYSNVPEYKDYLALARVARCVHCDDVYRLVHQLVDSAVHTGELHRNFCLIALLAGNGGSIQDMARLGFISDIYQGRLERSWRRGSGGLGLAVYKLQAFRRGDVLGDGHIFGRVFAGQQGVALLEVRWRGGHAVLALACDEDGISSHALSGFINIADHHVHFLGNRGNQLVDKCNFLRAGAVRPDFNLLALRPDQFVSGQQVDR